MINCPVCGSVKYNTLFEAKLEEAVENLSNDIAKMESLKKIVYSIWGTDSCLFVKCCNCDFSFSIPFKAGTNEFYNLLYDQTVSYPKVKWEYEITKSVMGQVIAESDIVNPRFLEIGAGEGAFLDLISNNTIFRSNIAATEFSKTGICKMKEKGYKTFNADIRDISDNYALKYDFVAAFQVLEHLDDVYSFFESIINLLKHQGIIFISVPNPVQRAFFDKRNIHMDIPPTHIGRYTIKTFQKICNKMNLSLVDYKYEPMTYFQKFRKFLFYLYAKEKHSESIESNQNKTLKIIKRYILLLYLLFLNIKTFVLLTNSQLGTSLWVYIRRR